ncbi:MAG: VOC family protein, partial [Micropepsaceae bacterium]
MTSDEFTRRGALGLAAVAAVTIQTAGAKPGGEVAMERVTGIGGFFFKAKDPAALAKWYEENLGVDPVPKDYGGTAWRQEAGTTVFAPFKWDTGYFGKPEQMWMLNFRVRSLDKMAAQLKGRGIAVEIDP